MDDTHIHGTIPVNMENMHQIKYLSIELLQPNTRFYYYPGTSLVVVVVTDIVILMFKRLTKYLSSYQLYFS